ncbi:MAG: NAD-dependent epimerase/dehydratase family protein [Acidimicrobiales bacterium]|nr:NAD-dependent epimerase/dehydratase family protein [Acidimicrobiales bacterium]
MKVLVAGAGGFIGGHLVASLLADGVDVRAVDRKPRVEWLQCFADAENVTVDLDSASTSAAAVAGCDRVFNLACDMGGMGFIELNKALCMRSVLTNTHLIAAAVDAEVDRYFFASTACVYPQSRQDTTAPVALCEDDAYPADPEDGYGWEKLFSERMCRHHAEDFGLDVRIARFHSVYGPHCTWQGGREKVPAAICRKVAEAAADGVDEIEVWGDGEQRRSFLYVDDAIVGVRRLMDSEVSDPINIGSAEMVSINDLIDTVSAVAGVALARRHDLSAPQGVRGRSSDNTMVRERLGWEPTTTLREGIEPTYRWVAAQLGTGTVEP